MLNTINISSKMTNSKINYIQTLPVRRLIILTLVVVNYSLSDAINEHYQSY